MDATAPWVDLAQPMYEDMPRALEATQVRFVPHPVDDGPPEASIRITHLTLSSHVGTHVDAALHFLPDGRSIDQYPAGDFTGPGIVLDVAREGVVPLDRPELEERAPDVRPGDIVFFGFGYGARFGTPGYVDHPYLTADAAAWLVERGVRMIGVDTPTPDLGGAHRPVGFGFPVHMTLLRHDILIFEHLGPELARLGDRRVEIVAAPLPIRGADGAPARVLARVAEATT